MGLLARRHDGVNGRERWNTMALLLVRELDGEHDANAHEKDLVGDTIKLLDGRVLDDKTTGTAMLERR